MIYRIKQFVSGLTARMNPEDHLFIKSYLNEKEQQLFYKLRASEQVHSSKVAYGCQSEAPTNTNLIKAALLHDVGKIDSNLTLINKSLVVIVSKLGIKNDLLPGFLKKSVYFKNQHAKIGYDYLKTIDTDPDILKLVRDHHDISDDPDIKILQKHDNLN
ncbi:HD domain-containing protein [Alkaliphilus peptidifermentans]|uniref:HDIG domain-containing protein n=1 Tax=Alkaliphilus peptidifermentans DSM 18978 TaxID=1120976 RepID=A0A1G5EL13_9FIRM|nr:HD domain-containing protein [Alkaliphilus peptidifermentans]SCY27646.1 HDIG domain-containing protein [Alkaliphilus peptidifermentans DSM 18978]